MPNLKPTVGSERLEVVDALRGFALFGILLANLCSFLGLYVYSPEQVIQLPKLDRSVLFMIDWFVEGKFYGIFSILFGIGFAIQADRFRSVGDKFSTFWFKRMVVLLIVGLLHMFLVWNGDILTLYSLLGMLLPLFLACSNRSLLRWIVLLLLTPLLIHGLLYLTQDASIWGAMSRFSTALRTQWGFADLTNLEMRTSDIALEVFSINVLQSIPRPMSYFVSGRYFHVLGLFLVGLLLARCWLTKIRNKDISIPKAAIWMSIFGFITHFGYALIKAMIGTPFALTEIGLLQGVIYHLGATVFSLGISMIFVYAWASGRFNFVFRNLALLGRMALTNYLFQNLLGVLIFFGYGFGQMGKVPFVYIPLIAIGILTAQWVFSRVWLGRFNQGPFEYMWRKLTYRSS